jgi:hypothetical protein
VLVVGCILDLIASQNSFSQKFVVAWQPCIEEYLNGSVDFSSPLSAYMVTDYTLLAALNMRNLHTINLSNCSTVSGA